MVPDHENLSKQHSIYSGAYAAGHYCSGSTFSDGFLGLMSSLEGYGGGGSDPMAEDESRTETTHDASGSSSKEAHDQERDDQGWLQLSIGGGRSRHSNSKEDHQVGERSTRRGGLVELDLLPTGSSSSSTAEQVRTLTPMFHVPEFAAPRQLTTTLTTPTPYSAPSLFFPHPGPGTLSSFPLPDVNWGFGTVPRNTSAAASSSTSGFLGPAAASFYPRPFQVHSGGLGVAVGGPALDFRVIDPPRRPYSGVWFMLQAAQYQTKEPFLPQISKSFLRIKDGRITVRLVLKYLVSKLNLESESEIEIRCRGQQVEPFLTLQHVRDSIWRTGNPRDTLTLLPHSSALDHIMVLHYARIA